ncbi:MAG: sulfurtransferase TusA family protein [Parabacteroides merdae]
MKVDACGLMCPGPVMQLKKNYEALKIGEQLQITATDQAFGKDVTSWCKMTGAELDLRWKTKTGWSPPPSANRRKQLLARFLANNADNKTLIVFSDTTWTRR